MDVAAQPHAVVHLLGHAANQHQQQRLRTAGTPPPQCRRILADWPLPSGTTQRRFLWQWRT